MVSTFIALQFPVELRSAILALIGIVVASLGFYLEPQLVAHRLNSSPNRRNMNPAIGLVPFFGATRLTPQPLSNPESGVVATKAKASMFAPIVMATEALMGLTFMALGLHFDDLTELLLACVYTALLFEIGLIDFHYRLVLNVLSYPGAALALAGSFLWAGIGPGRALLGGAAALLIFGLIEVVGRGAMGRGDTKLAVLVGLTRGYPAVWTALISGVILGGIAAGILLISGKGRRQKFAYGPYLAAGAVLSLFLTGSS